jgi:hypothetical protein
MSKITIIKPDETDAEYELIIVADEFTYRIKPHVFPRMAERTLYLERVNEYEYALTPAGIERGYTVRESVKTQPAPFQADLLPLDDIMQDDIDLSLERAQGVLCDAEDALEKAVKQLLIGLIRVELFAHTPDWAYDISFNFNGIRQSIGISARERLTHDCPKPRNYGLVKYLEPETEAFLLKYLHLLDRYGSIWIGLDEAFEGYTPKN